MARSPTTEMLGEVTVPSGVVALLDAGLLWLWSHDQPPLMPEGRYPDETVRIANAAIDLAIVGRDAAAAGRAFGRQGDPHFVYDVPAHAVGQVQADFGQTLRDRGLDARLEPLPGRVPHRQRIANRLASGGGEFSFHGVPACCAGGVPADRPLRVLGERMPAGPYADRWRAVWLECRPGRVAGSVPLGRVGVDAARLVFADADALGAWRHDEPIDGRADFVLWGRDAAAVAARFGLPDLGDGLWGVLDRPVDEVVRLGVPVEEFREASDLRFATDFRPHSHHWQAMGQVRASRTESGTVAVGGAAVCVWMTTWGDGFFPVVADRDGDGRLVRLRVEVGNDDAVRRQDQLAAT